MKPINPAIPFDLALLPPLPAWVIERAVVVRARTIRTQATGSNPGTQDPGKPGPGSGRALVDDPVNL